MDALELLEEDHKRFKAMLKDGEETTERARVGRAELLKRLTRDLQIHERMEEEVLYPALKTHPEAKDIVLEGFEEHHVADMIIAELSETDVSDERWAAKWKVLQESLEHHIEEEEGEMFKKAKKIFDKEQREAMGQEMEAIRAEEK
ncbi:MAG TPA: hemerythrin domain-containing protein [Longimicrobiales bacterium]|nr:hemerythrin domain-containing protein [Longimicrobiales bacterium]